MAGVETADPVARRGVPHDRAPRGAAGYDALTIGAVGGRVRIQRVGSEDVGRAKGQGRLPQRGPGLLGGRRVVRPEGESQCQLWIHIERACRLEGQLAGDRDVPLMFGIAPLVQRHERDGADRYDAQRESAERQPQAPAAGTTLAALAGDARAEELALQAGRPQVGMPGPFAGLSEAGAAGEDAFVSAEALPLPCGRGPGWG